MAIAETPPDLEIIYPVHLNPNIKNVVHKYLKGFSRIHIIEPQSYEVFSFLIIKSWLILTDSGGIQEETITFHVPNKRCKRLYL